MTSPNASSGEYSRRRRLRALAVLAAILLAAGVTAIVTRQYRTLPPPIAESTQAVQGETKAAFAATAPATGSAADATAIAATLARFDAALKSHDIAAGEKTLDLDRLYDELMRVLGGKVPLLTRQADFKKGLGIGVDKIFSPSGTMRAWESADVRLIKPLDTVHDVVVIAKLRYPSQVQPMRFWFHDDGEWRVYDWEDLSLGLRATTLMGQLMTVGVESSVTKRTQAFITGIQQSNAGNLTAAEQIFAGVDRAGLPPNILSAIETAHGSALLRLNRPTQALPHLKAAEAANADAPIVMTLLAAACNRTDDYDGAVRASRRAIDLLGPNGLANYNLGHALTRLGKRDEAVTVLEQGLAVDPQSRDCMLGLADALPPEHQQEVGHYFARSGFTKASFRSLASAIKPKHAPLALAAVAAAYVDANGHTIDGDFYAASALLEQGQNAEAAELFGQYLSTDDPYYVKAVKPSYEVAKRAADADAATRPTTRPASDAS